MKKPLKILHLYAQDMNIYGDYGNVLTIKKRAEQHGYDAAIITYDPGQEFPSDVDMIIGGGGQDSGQSLIQNDLLSIGDQLKKLADDDVPMLVICGLYQLFGNFFETVDGQRIDGIGLFDLETFGGKKRMIGNIVTRSPFGELIGYENHSGVTTLGTNQQPLGIVLSGDGNNGQDKTEGAIYRHVYGSYMHGSLLPKNPVFADALIAAAATRRYGNFTPQYIDDHYAEQARIVAKSRPRS